MLTQKTYANKYGILNSVKLEEDCMHIVYLFLSDDSEGL